MKFRISQARASHFLRACLLAAGCASVEASATEVYHWKDADGKVHFSDQRNATDGARPVTVNAPAQRPNPELDKYRVAVRTQLAALDAQRKEDADRAATQRIIAAGVEKNCKQLRNAMRTEETVALLYTFDDAGERQFLDDKQRAEYKASLSQQWHRYCN